MILFTDLAALIPFARLRSNRGIYTGEANDYNLRLILACSHLYSIAPDISARLIYTRDSGHHTSGWWKNPDYERCLHLSISFCVNPTDAPLPFDKKQAQKIAEAFFENSTSKCWIEPPYSEEGKRCDVHHYRLFCNPSWSPLLPRGEVYSKELTEAGWRSFSDIHGQSHFDSIDAPFLKNAQ